MRKFIYYTELLQDILKYLEVELAVIQRGQYSKWEESQLLEIVYPEINELLSFARRNKVFFKYGKRQRMLESTHLITDSLSTLNKTLLGKKILELQEFYNSI